VLGQVVHDQVHELDLARRVGLAVEEPGERFLGGLAIETDERANEEPRSSRMAFADIL
jgi:hypothetical protein